MTPGASLAWLDWSTEAFAAAHRRARPVLLVVGAAWSPASRRLERMLADPPGLRDVTSRFVLVHVDADRRPDIADRYGLVDEAGLGAWPTIVCLTPDGEVLSGGALVEASRLTRALATVADTFDAQRDELERRARDGRRARRDLASASATSDGAIDPDAVANIARRLKDAFDVDHAGFGFGSKRPHAAAVALALTQGLRANDGELREMAVRTLDRLGWSLLSDAETGAFHRACRTRAWTEPDTARLLGVQAELAGLFLDAAAMLDDDVYAERARAALGFVVGHLADHAGGFFESEETRILVTSSNARIVRTLLRAADVLNAPPFGETALATIERLVPLVYASGAGVAHYLDEGARPRVRGLLIDQVETSAALIDLFRASGNRVYLELAEELMRSCLRKLWRDGHGGFLDRLRSASGGGDIGLLADPLVPFGVNCLAARVLASLARETGHDDLRRRAIDTLTALMPDVERQGVDAADYALALVDVLALQA